MYLSTAFFRAAFIIISIISIGLLLGGLALNSAEICLVVVGIFCFLSTSLPIIIKRRIQILDPIILFVFSVLMGCTLRAIWIALTPSSDYKLIFLTNATPIADMLEFAWWVPISLLCFSVGYICTNKRLAVEKMFFLRGTTWKRNRVILICAAFTIIAILSTWKLSEQFTFDLSDIGSFSKKRSGTNMSYASLVWGGYYRWGTTLSRVAALILIAYILTSQKTWRPSTIRGLAGSGIAICLISIAIAWPIISSSRTSVITLIFSIFVLFVASRSTIERNRGISLQLITLVFLAISILIVVVLGIWRQYEKGEQSELRDKTLTAALVNNTIASGNFMPLERTAIIIANMHDNQDWWLGKSYASVFVAPVPRALWPDKPIISIGLDVKRNIYERPGGRNGYPPGMLGEAFMNFGYSGILAIPFLLGLMLRVFSNSFIPLLGRNRNATILYAVLLWPGTVSLSDLNFSLMMIEISIITAPLLLALWFISSSDQRMIHGL